MPIGMELASRAGFAAVLANERARAAARCLRERWNLRAAFPQHFLNCTINGRWHGLKGWIEFTTSTAERVGLKNLSQSK